MGPLLFANWRQINTLFCLCMWAVAVGLAVIVIAHAISASAAVQRHPHAGMVSPRRIPPKS